MKTESMPVSMASMRRARDILREPRVRAAYLVNAVTCAAFVLSARQGLAPAQAWRVLFTRLDESQVHFGLYRAGRLSGSWTYAYDDEGWPATRMAPDKACKSVLADEAAHQAVSQMHRLADAVLAGLESQVWARAMDPSTP